jgi:hypothetical protein
VDVGGFAGGGGGGGEAFGDSCCAMFFIISVKDFFDKSSSSSSLEYQLSSSISVNRTGNCVAIHFLKPHCCIRHVGA